MVLHAKAKVFHDHVDPSKPLSSAGGEVPSVSEFSTVYCDPHSQRLWHSKAEIDVFLELSSFFDDPSDVGNLISGSSAFSKTSLNIWKVQLDDGKCFFQSHNSSLFFQVIIYSLSLSVSVLEL